MKYFSLFLILFFLISLTNSAPSHEEFELNQNWKFKELQSLNDYLPAVVPGLNISDFIKSIIDLTKMNYLFKFLTFNA